MEVRLLDKSWRQEAWDLVVTALPQDPDLRQLERLSAPTLQETITQLSSRGEWKGEEGSSLRLYGFGSDPMRLVLCGLGPREEIDPGTIRRCLAQSLKTIKGSPLNRVALFLSDECDSPGMLQAALEGCVLAGYDPAELRSQKVASRVTRVIGLFSEGRVTADELAPISRRASIIGDSINLARSLTNQPGNILGPLEFGDRAAELAGSTNLGVEVLGEPELRELGLNALLGVAAGSSKPPRLIILGHRTNDAADGEAVVFVGKGVTFDSGGLSLKSADSMVEMKSDKAGACSVLAAMLAISRLDLKQAVWGVLPVVENLPGQNAQRPGDVIRSFSGKTIEVINTDAEGRLILADAIAYATQRFEPRAILDFATLTGACVVALGHERAGLFSNDERLLAQFDGAASEVGEKYWRLPLDRAYRKEIESTIADVKNSGSRWGGAITAAKFLQEFVGETPWCHIDMAGLDLLREGSKAVGPSGFGVASMVELVSSLERG